MFSNHNYMSLIKKGHFQEALDYRASTIPDYVYKFFWLGDNEERNKKRFDTLKESQLWFAAPSEQNDPYEFKTMYLNKEKMRDIGFTDESITKIESLLMSCAICCFVENSSDNMPMWAHYANQHQGYCVKYKVKNKYGIRNVVYERDRIPIATILANFFHKAKEFDEGIGEESDVRLYSTILQENYFLKHISWSSEHEYRMVYPMEKKSALGEKINIEDIGLEVVEIICGYKCNDAHVEQLKAIAEALNVPCKKCSISETAFSVLNEA